MVLNMFGQSNNDMNQIKNVVSNILSEHRKIRFNESYRELEHIEDKDFLIERYVSITRDLLNEGYDLSEIEVPDSLQNLDIKSTLTDAAITSAKEYAIRFVLSNVLGVGPAFSTFSAQLLADYNPLELLKIFKNKEECDTYFPKLSDRLITMAVRYITSTKIGVDSNNYGLGGIVPTLSGNIFGEVIEDSDVSEKISKKFCEFVH